MKKKYKDIEVNNNCFKTRWSLPCLGKVGTTARLYKRTQKDLKIWRAVLVTDKLLNWRVNFYFLQQYYKRTHTDEKYLLYKLNDSNNAVILKSRWRHFWNFKQFIISRIYYTWWPLYSEENRWQQNHFSQKL